MDVSASEAEARMEVKAPQMKRGKGVSEKTLLAAVYRIA